MGCVKPLMRGTNFCANRWGISSPLIVEMNGAGSWGIKKTLQAFQTLGERDFGSCKSAQILVFWACLHGGPGVILVGCAQHRARGGPPRWDLHAHRLHLANPHRMHGDGPGRTGRRALWEGLNGSRLRFILIGWFMAKETSFIAHLVYRFMSFADTGTMQGYSMRSDLLYTGNKQS